jgi:serine phosphatase RsbU (regulator of sigma subunit)/Tfp pilus assembly protein PilF
MSATFSVNPFKAIRFVFALNLCFSLLVMPFSLSASIEDSLIQVIKTSSGKQKLDAICNLCNQTVKNKPDEIMLRAEMLKQIWQDEKNTVAQFKYYYFIGLSHFYKGEYKSALVFYDSAYSVSFGNGHRNLTADIYMSRANVFEETGENLKCVENYINAAKIYEELKDMTGLANSTNNIGITYAQNSDWDNALKFFIRSNQAQIQAANIHGIGNTYNNIGLVYTNLGKLDSAGKYLELALHTWEKAGDGRGVAMTCNGLGRLRTMTGNYREALFYLNKSLSISEEMNDLYGKAQNLLAIGEVYDVQDKTDLAIGIYKQAYEIAVQSGNNRKIAMLAQRLFRAFYRKKDFANAVEYLKTYSDLRDTLVKEDQIKAVEEMKTLYETEKNELMIEGLEKDKKLNEKQIEKQRLVLVSLISGLVFILFFSFMLFRQFSAKKRAYLLLEKKNEEVMQKNEEISAQRDEIAAQRDLATRQRDIIAHQQQDITDSIRYAFRIQSALFPDESDVRILLKDYFIFYQPRDIVSGDFYWMNKSDEKIIIVAADCTGHGVPGAFMSMLGIAFLSEVVNKEQITSPDKILNRLRENIILAMKQHGENVKQQDGMDAVAITIDRKNATLQFAGANNPLYIIKSAIGHWPLAVGPNITEANSQQPIASSQLIELKGDKMPVAIYSRMQPFSQQSVPIASGDLIYIFSDGFADQFGGPDLKKFKYKPFKELLSSNSHKPMEEQRDILKKTFDDWRGDYPQIDDVLIIGIRI